MQHLQTRTAIAEARLLSWRRGEVDMEEYLTWHTEETSVVEALGRVYTDRGGRLLGTVQERQDATPKIDHSAAARAAEDK
jgi:hypothetical protein